MSLTVIATVRCDGCAEWVYATDVGGNSTLTWRRSIGWTTDRSSGRRVDYCPACSKTRGG